MFIDRDREASAFKQMGDALVSSPLVKYLSERSVTIVNFITGGCTLKKEYFLKDDLRGKIVDPIMENPFKWWRT